MSGFFRPTSAPFHSAARLGIGDDAAIIQMPEEGRLVCACKTLVAGIDFERNADAGELGPRLVRHCVASLRNRETPTPQFALLILTTARADPQWLSAFADGLHQELRQFEIDLVGGDTTEGPLSVGLTVYGWTT